MPADATPLAALRTVAVLGLGAMGSRMAARLHAAGFAVTGWNRSPGPRDALAALGASVAETPRMAAEGADAVLSMVTDDEAARAVWLDPETGALAGLRPGALAIESSTITPGWAQGLAGAVAARGGAFLEAPVAGSRPQAEAGALIHFLAADDAAIAERAAPLLAALGGARHFVGPVGTAAMIKLLVNALFAVQVATMAEFARFFDDFGLDGTAALDVIGATPVASPGAVAQARLMLAGRFAPMFPIDLVAKDLRYLVDVASEKETALPMVERARALVEQARALGFGEEHLTALVKVEKI